MDDAPFAGRSLHFIGIGGAGMSGLALVARALGARVTGSDQADSPVLERLREAGVEAAVGHDAPTCPPGAEVVVSTAIPEDNVELAAARAAGATVLHRAQLLGELSRMKRTIAVDRRAREDHHRVDGRARPARRGRDPAFLIGGELRSAASNAAWGTGDWAVIEADESDRSFLELGRDVAVITNVELDHHATYAASTSSSEAMEEFARPAELRVVGPDVGLPGETLATGIGPGDGAARRRPGAAAERLALRGGGARRGAARAGPPQRAQRARGAGGVPRGRAWSSPTRPPPWRTSAAPGGASSRTGAADGRARLRRLRPPPDGGARHARGGPHARGGAAARSVACFQPHLYSRTRALARDFGRSLALADVSVVVDVYPARERAEDFPGVSGLLVAEATADAAGGRPVWWLPELELALRMLESQLGEHDLLVTLGAGDVDRVAKGLTA